MPHTLRDPAVQELDDDDSSDDQEATEEPQQQGEQAHAGLARRQPEPESKFELVPPVPDALDGEDVVERRSGPKRGYKLTSKLYAAFSLNEDDPCHVVSFEKNDKFEERRHQGDVRSILQGWLKKLSEQVIDTHRKLVSEASVTPTGEELDRLEQQLLLKKCSICRALVNVATSGGKGGMIALILLIFAFEMGDFDKAIKEYSPHLFGNIHTAPRVILHASQKEWVTEMIKEVVMRDRPKEEEGETWEQFREVRDNFKTTNWMVRIAKLSVEMAENLRSLFYVFNVEGYGDGAVGAGGFDRAKFENCSVFVCTDATLHNLLKAGKIKARDAALRVRDEDEDDGSHDGKHLQQIHESLPFTFNLAFTGTPTKVQEDTWHPLQSVTLGDLLTKKICPEIYQVAIYSEGMKTPDGTVIDRTMWDSPDLSEDNKRICQSLYREEMTSATVLAGIKKWFVEMDKHKTPLQMAVHCPSTPHLKELDKLKQLCCRIVQRFSATPEGIRLGLDVDAKKQFEMGHGFAAAITKWAANGLCDNKKLCGLKDAVANCKSLLRLKPSDAGRRVKLQDAQNKLQNYKFAWQSGSNIRASELKEKFPFVNRNNEEQVAEINEGLRKVLDAYHQRKPPAEIVGDLIAHEIKSSAALDKWLGPVSVWDKNLKKWKDGPRIHPVLGRVPCAGVMHGNVTAESIWMRKPGEHLEVARRRVKTQLKKVAHQLRNNEIDILCGSDSIVRALDAPAISVSVMLTAFTFEKESEARNTQQKLARSYRRMYPDDPRLLAVANNRSAAAIKKYDLAFQNKPIDVCRQEAKRRLIAHCRTQSVHIVENALNRNHVAGGPLEKLFKKHGAASAFKPVAEYVQNIDKVTLGTQIDLSDYEASVDDSEEDSEGEGEGEEDSKGGGEADAEGEEEGDGEPEETDKEDQQALEAEAAKAAKEQEKERKRALANALIEQMIEKGARQKIYAEEGLFKAMVCGVDPECNFLVGGAGQIVSTVEAPGLAKLLRGAIANNIDVDRVWVEMVDDEDSTVCKTAVPEILYSTTEDEPDDNLRFSFPSEMDKFEKCAFLTIRAVYNPVQAQPGDYFHPETEPQLCSTMDTSFVDSDLKERLMQEAAEKATEHEHQQAARAAKALMDMPVPESGIELVEEEEDEASGQTEDGVGDEEDKEDGVEDMQEDDEDRPLRSKRPRPAEEPDCKEAEAHPRRSARVAGRRTAREEEESPDDEELDAPVILAARAVAPSVHNSEVEAARKVKPVREQVKDYDNLTANQLVVGAEAIQLVEKKLVECTSTPAGFTGFRRTEVAFTELLDGTSKKPLAPENYDMQPIVAAPVVSTAPASPEDAAKLDMFCERAIYAIENNIATTKESAGHIDPDNIDACCMPQGQKNSYVLYLMNHLHSSKRDGFGQKVIKSVDDLPCTKLETFNLTKHMARTLNPGNHADKRVMSFNAAMTTAAIGLGLTQFDKHDPRYFNFRFCARMLHSPAPLALQGETSA